MLSPLKFFDPDADVAEKFSNTIYRPVENDQQNDCVVYGKIFILFFLIYFLFFRVNVKIARPLQGDLKCKNKQINAYTQARNPKSAITRLDGLCSSFWFLIFHFYICLLGNKEERNTTPQKMVKCCGLKDACIVVCPVGVQSNGDLFVGPNWPIAVSNFFKAGILKYY